MAAEFGWWPMSPWLSPGAAWFIFINVVVGAIAVMTSSRGQQDDARGESGTRRKLVRTASTVVLDSLRSISIFPFHSAGGDYSVACSAPASQLLHHVQEERCRTFQEETQEVAPQPQLRVPEAASVAEERAVVLPQSAHVAALGTSATASESHVEDGESSSSISFDEAYALARASRRQAAADAVARVPGKRVPLAEIKVRAYGRCGRATEEVEGKAEVNARAEQFIRQFREELKLERINSILSYTHALRRGAGAATAR